MPKVEIKAGDRKSSVEIRIDGQRILGVTKFSVAANASGPGWPPLVTLEVLALELMIDVEDADYHFQEAQALGDKPTVLEGKLCGKHSPARPEESTEGRVMEDDR